MERTGEAVRSRIYGNPVLKLVVHPLTVFIILAGGVAFLTYQGSRYDSSVCRQQILDGKRALQERLLEEQRKRIQEQQQQAPASVAPGKASPSAFGGAFSPNTLAPGSTPAPGKPNSPSAFGGAFNPNALKPQ